MQAQSTPEYYVVWANGVGLIRRNDADGRSRSVATIANEHEWRDFQDCIAAGYDEVDAVKELDR